MFQDFGVNIKETNEDYLYQCTYYGLSKFIYDTGLFEDLNVRGVSFSKVDMYICVSLKLGYTNSSDYNESFISYVELYISRLITKYSLNALNFKYSISNNIGSDLPIILTFKVSPATTFREVFKIDDKKIRAWSGNPNTYFNEEVKYLISSESKYILNLIPDAVSSDDCFLGEEFQRFIMRNNRLSKIICLWKHPYDCYAPIYDKFTDIVNSIELLGEIDILCPQYPSYFNCGLSIKPSYCFKIDVLSDIPWDIKIFENTLYEFWNNALKKYDFYGNVYVEKDSIIFMIPSLILKKQRER